MKRRKWTNEAKATIVLSGLKGLSVGELCNEHGISQSQYYQWRDQFLAGASKVFDTEKPTKKQQRLVSENQKLKNLVGELTMELKKTTESGYEAWILCGCGCHKRPLAKQNPCTQG